MKRILLVVLLLSAFLFTQAQKIKVACVGNSITEGAAIEAGKKYPDQLQTLLGDGYEVRNYGLGGRTLLKKGNRPYWNEPKYQEVLQWAPDIVIIKLGTNDSKPANWQYKDSFVSDYIAFVESFKQLASHPRVYVCFPIPAYDNKFTISGAVIKNEIIPDVRKVAKKTRSKIIDLYHPLLGKPEVLYDGVHPNAAGATIMANVVYKAIK
jgi:lysophospholipase L1-like esterase